MPTPSQSVAKSSSVLDGTNLTDHKNIDETNNDSKGNNQSFVTADSAVQSVGSSTSMFSNIKLTPITNIQNLGHHNKEELTRTLRKARKGETFLPEGLKFPDQFDASKVSTADSNKSGIFPQASSSPKHDSTSGVSRSFFNSQPGLRASRTKNGTLNPIKGAYNLFDRKLNFDGSPSRKRKRVLTPEFEQPVENVTMSELEGRLIKSDRVEGLKGSNLTTGHVFMPRIESGNTSLNEMSMHSNYFSANSTKEKSESHHDEVESQGIIRSLLGDPQCITNLTLIIQIVMNTVVVACLIAIVIICFMSVKRDVDRKVQTYVIEMVHKINSCRREYLRNNCAPEMRAPALESSCTEWENCMNEDPESVVTSVAYFEVMADCMNAFFHNLSFRTLCSMAGLLFFIVIVPNMIFNKFRSTTTTNNNTYYNITREQSTTDSPMKVYGGNGRILDTSVMSTPSPQKLLDNTLNNSTVYFTPIQADETSFSKGKGSSVRFNPKVDYSFYDGDSSPCPPRIRRRNNKY